MKYIDLFSDVGGLSLGFKNAGFEIWFFSNEIDKYAVKTQKRNLKYLGDDPNKVISCSIEELHDEIIGDEIVYSFQGDKVVKHGSEKILYKNAPKLELSQKEMVRSINQVDLIVGGPPCQGFFFCFKRKEIISSKRL